MHAYRCRNCDASVKRGRLCSRCGHPQPPRVARALLRTAGFALLAFGFVTTVRSLEASAPEFKAPAPSGGNWESEESFSGGDERPNEPSVFMLDSANATGSTGPQIPSFLREK